MQNVVELKALRKKFGDRVVVDGIDLEIKKGECFGFLGPNGAGKSTTLKMIYGSTQIDEGEIFVLGLNAKKSSRQIKSRIGVVPQDDALDADFNVYENLKLFSAYHGIDPILADKRISELLKLVRLEDSALRSVEKLSGGMKRRVAIARGLVNQPEVLVFDEPTTGLDPQARIWIWEFIRKIKSEISAVLLTTHYMEEAEQICDRIAIIDGGKILTVGTPKALISQYIGKSVVEYEVAPDEMNYCLRRLDAEKLQYQIIHNRVNVHLSEDLDPQKVMGLIPVSKVTLRQASLNDVFLKLAGHDLHD